MYSYPMISRRLESEIVVGVLRCQEPCVLKMSYYRRVLEEILRKRDLLKNGVPEAQVLGDKHL